MRKLIILATAGLLSASDLSPFAIDTVCGVYSNDISKETCKSIEEANKKLESIHERMSDEKVCKVIKEANILFETADRILDGSYKKVKNPKQEKGLEGFLGMQMDSGLVENYLDYADTFNEVYISCAEKEEAEQEKQEESLFGKIKGWFK